MPLTNSTAVVETTDFGAIPVHRRSCPLCGRDNDTAPASRYSHADWKIKDCADCGFVYIDRAPAYEMQFTTLAWEQTSRVEEKRRAEIRPISYKMSKRLRFRMHLLPRKSVMSFIQARISTGNILDLGCGGGLAMLDCPPAYTPFGIEISTELAAQADRLFQTRGGRCVNADCVSGLEQLPADHFAAASLRSYLEHESHPLPVLQGLHRVLAPNGFAIVKVPNYATINRMFMGKRWCGFRYPDHLNYFTPGSLRAMAAKAGFTTHFGPTGALPTSDNMWAVLTRRD